MGGSAWFPSVGGGADRPRAQERSSIEGLLRKHRSGRLYDAAMNMKTHEIKELLQAGADANFADEEGRLPLHAAAFSGSLDVLHLLLAGGADPSMAQGDDRPLVIAAWQGHVEIARRLLEAGAQPDTPDGRGSTPLCSAAAQGHTAVVQALLSAHADPGKAAFLAGLGTVKPLQAAARGGHRRVAEVLQHVGGGGKLTTGSASPAAGNAAACVLLGRSGTNLGGASDGCLGKLANCGAGLRQLLCERSSAGSGRR